MQIVIAELGLDLTVKEFVGKVRNDPENYFGWEASFFSIQTWFNLCFKCFRRVIFQVWRRSAVNFQHNNQRKDFGETADFVQKDTKHEIGTG